MLYFIPLDILLRLISLWLSYSLLVATDEIQHPSTSKELKIPLIWEGNHRC